MKTRIADAVLRAPLKGGGSLVVYVIVEHKREEGAEDLLQVAQYVLDVHRWLLAKHGLPMPPVVPLILYNGREPWRGARSFHALIEGPRADTLNFTATVIDVARLSNASIAQARDLRQGLLTLKTPAVPLEDIERTMTELLRSTRGDDDSRELAFEYLEHALPIEAHLLAEAAQKKYKQREEPTMPTWSQTIRKDAMAAGERLGKREATEEAVRTVLASRFGELPRRVDTRLKRARLATLQKLLREVATVSSADELFAG